MSFGAVRTFGSVRVLIVAITAFRSVSMTDTVSEPKLATYSRGAEGCRAMPPGLSPTGMVICRSGAVTSSASATGAPPTASATASTGAHLAGCRPARRPPRMMIDPFSGPLQSIIVQRPPAVSRKDHIG